MPTVHIRWNDDIAILAGDAMFAYCFGQIAAEFPEQANLLVTKFSQVALEVCEGQMLDLELAKQESVTIPDYIEMIRKKTAVLLGGALYCGAIAGGAPIAEAERLYQFGEYMGIAFQIQDDLLDVYGDPNKFGKQVGGDILENKRTFLLIRALEQAPQATKTELYTWLSQNQNPEAKIAAITQIYNKLNIRQQTQLEINRYFSQAKQQIEPLLFNPGINFLHNFLQEVMERES
ncbi:MAG: polyprenyl synthetase family protein, partial [Bacteroidia bacterium]|nr:polyprenyl synthetase family protein [Bacteroidia bacterium]